MIYYLRGGANLAGLHYDKALADYGEALKIYPAFVQALNGPCLSG